MTGNKHDVFSDEKQSAWADLGRLLGEQIAASRAGQFTKVEALSVQADDIVMRLARHGDQTATAEGMPHEDLERLYNELILMLKAEQAEVHGGRRGGSGIREA